LDAFPDGETIHRHCQIGGFPRNLSRVLSPSGALSAYGAVGLSRSTSKKTVMSNCTQFENGSSRSVLPIYVEQPRGAPAKPAGSQSQNSSYPRTSAPKWHLTVHFSRHARDQARHQSDARDRDAPAGTGCSRQLELLSRTEMIVRRLNSLCQRSHERVRLRLTGLLPK
jgi:hypothetical protein